ncbi:MAG: hypothetical protein HY744_01320 [Deltaproteobacteria bacterium]|nr:hypothetical protein [Deltaproteobacteria bacterium]
MDPKELSQEVEAIEDRLERLRSLYQQYFMGIEKIEPSTLRKEVDRKFWQLRKMRINNPMVRFRLQMLIQRYNTYQQYWTRVLREIEQGTFRRDVARAAERVGRAEALTIVGRRRAKLYRALADAAAQRDDRRHALGAGADAPAGYEPGEETPTLRPPVGADPAAAELAAAQLAAAGTPAVPTWDLSHGSAELEQAGSAQVGPDLVDPRAWNLGTDLGLDDEAGAAPPAPAPAVAPPAAKAEEGRRAAGVAAARRRPLAPEGSDDAPSDESDLRALYQRYVEAKRAANEPTDGMTYEKLARSLRDQTAKLRTKHGAGRRIDYEVVVTGGKPRLRPMIR